MRSGPAFTLLMCSCFGLFSAAGASSAFAQESPYIVTYNHYLEEPGSLEVEYFSTLGTQRAGNDFVAPVGRVRSTVSRHGGRRKSISTDRPPSETAPFSPAIVGKTASAYSRTSISLIQ